MSQKINVTTRNSTAANEFILLSLTTHTHLLTRIVITFIHIATILSQLPWHYIRRSSIFILKSTYIRFFIGIIMLICDHEKCTHDFLSYAVF